MPIGIYFELQNLDAQTYAAINERLGGLDDPPGRTFHAALHVDEQIHVFDVWESHDAFEAFGAVLLPMLADYGVDPGQPRIGEIERIVTARPPSSPRGSFDQERAAP
jgi:hypothetical protein